MNSKLRAARRAGRVARYHTSTLVHREDVAQHSFNLMNILMVMLNGNVSNDLLVAALLHDQGEYLTGDIPSPVKKMLPPAAKSHIEMVEEQAVNMIHAKGHPVLTEWEHTMLKVADNLDGLLKCIEEVELGNQDLIITGSTYCIYLENLLPKLGGSQSGDMVTDAIKEFNRKVSKYHE